MSSQIGGPPQPQTPSTARARLIELIVTVRPFDLFSLSTLLTPYGDFFLVSTGVKGGTTDVIKAHWFGDFVLRAGANDPHLLYESWLFMVQWRHRRSVAAPSLWFASRKERTETPHRRHSRPARPPCAASAPINIIRPENIMTSNYSFHGNTLALHGGALHHPFAHTVFVLVRKLSCIPASLSKVYLSMEMSELFTKIILAR